MDFCEEIEQRISEILDEDDLLNESDIKLEEPFTDPISKITYKFSLKKDENNKQIYKRKRKEGYWDDQSAVYNLDYAKDKDGNIIDVGFSDKMRVEIRKAIKKINDFNNLTDEEKEKISSKNSNLLFVGRGGSSGSKDSNKDVIKAQIGDYKCHRDGNDIIFTNVNDESDTFKFEMTTEQFKKLRSTFNEKSTRNGVETNKYVIDPSLITKERIIHRAERVLGIKTTTDHGSTSTSLSKKYEKDVADKLDDVLGNQVTKTIPSQKNQKYYAVDTGDSSKKSDILAVHDRKEFNTDKQKITDKDSSFYVEVKLNKLASFLNPFFTWSKKDGFQKKNEYGDKQDNQVVRGNATDDENIDDKEMMDIKGVGQTLEKMMNTVAGKQMEVYNNMLNEAIRIHNSKNKNDIIEEEIILPDSLYVLEKIYKKDISKKNKDIIELISDFIRGYNEIKLKNNYKGFKKNYDGSLYIVQNQIIDDKELLNHMYGLITKHYRDRGCAYIQIGSYGSDEKGNLYILDKNYDPLKLMQKNNIPLFSTAFNSCKINVSWQFINKKLYIAGNVRFPENSVKQSDVSIDGDFNVNDIDTTGDFFKS